MFNIAQLIATMSSRTAARLLAISQARSKMEELTKKEVVSFAFILTDDCPELIGEEDLVTELMGHAVHLSPPMAISNFTVQ